jgi:polyhydroxyalkanoate synthase
LGRDKRFADPEWRQNFVFDIMRRSYAFQSEWLQRLAANATGVDEGVRRKAAFFMKQAADAFSPSNFIFTNPAVLKKTLETGGENLLRGLDMLEEDLKRGKGRLALRQTDSTQFKIGENVAKTPGKVIFRNDILELIQYAPTTPTVARTPILFFPPWINKFYILDLRPDNSMVKWLVDQGHTVFVTSWVNPPPELADKTFADYLKGGILEALAAVEKQTGEHKIHAVGYCIAGTLLGSTLAYLAAKGDERVASATFFAAQLDFEFAGDLLVFTDNPGIAYIESKIEEAGGVLEGQVMSETFNALRAPDLYWSYVVSNYLLGEKPRAFDLLYWNADQTRMPKALHLYYLRRFYRDNALAKGRLTMLGQRLSLHDVTIPIFMQSSKEDHIAPCKSVFQSATYFGGPVEFIVAGSGHIAGVINHPDAKKYQYWTNRNLKGAIEDWLAFAEEHPGSWWTYWDVWLNQRGDERVPARIPGEGGLPALCDAPGEYVRIRSSTE